MINLSAPGLLFFDRIVRLLNFFGVVMIQQEELSILSEGNFLFYFTPPVRIGGEGSMLNYRRLHPLGPHKNACMGVGEWNGSDAHLIIDGNEGTYQISPNHKYPNHKCPR